MALQMEVTAEGLAKFRSAMETGTLVTLASAELYDGYSGGAVSGTKLATMTVRTNKSLDPSSNVFRFTCQDKGTDAYTAYSGKVLDADGVVVAIFHNGGEKVATKEEKAEVLIGCEIHFDDGVKLSDVVNMGDTSFYFNPDDATTEVKGIIELATEAEAKAGTDAKRAITPNTLYAVIQSHGNVVHRAGAEAITGYKSFEGGISKRDVSADVLIIPVNNLYSSLDFSDKNNKKYASVVGAIYNSGEFGAILATNRTIDGKEYHSQISVRLDKDGKAYATAPTPASDDSSTKIATTAWVNAVAKKLLSLAGGKMTATKAMSRNVANSFLGLHGGTGDTNDGAQLYLCGADHPEMPSAFQLHARNETVDNILEGTIGGLLKWIDKYVLNNSFQMPTDGGAIMLTAGTSAMGGAHFRLYGKSHSSGAGQFTIAATNGTNTKSLTGKPDGTLTWDGKNVVRSVSGITADAAGNVNLGDVLRVVASWRSGKNWYRKYSDGWIEQGGIIEFTEEDETVTKNSYVNYKTCNLHTPFQNTNYNVSSTTIENGDTKESSVNPDHAVTVKDITTSSFVAYWDDKSRGVYWYACGY